MHPQHTTISEEWRPIIGWEDWYSISNLGSVRRDAGGKGAQRGHCLTARPCRGGYPTVHLYRPHYRQAIMVHQLVMEAFIGPCPPQHEINHRNGNKADNMLHNLEYITHPDNQRHAYRLGLRHPMRGITGPSARLAESDVRAIRTLHATGVHTYAALGQRFGVHPETARGIVRRRIWRHIS